MLRMKVLIVLASAALLAACGEPEPGSVSGGECKAFKRAVIETCGLTQADQDYIDDNAERGIGACKFKRPLARTPTCQDLRDEISRDRAELVSLRAKQPMPPATPAKKKTILRRFIGG